MVGYEYHIGPANLTRHQTLASLHDRMRTRARHTRRATKRAMTMAAAPAPGGVVLRRVTRTGRKVAKISPPNMRAREVVGGLSPQQINPVKIRLDDADKFIPAYTVLFRHGTSKLGTLSAASKKVLGVTLEDGSEKRHPFSVVSNTGLMPVACPPQQAETFRWGDYVIISANDARITMGYAREIPKVTLVKPSDTNVVSGNHVCLGRFCGWPTGNPKDGGILVLVSV
jgi:hypothetical protein